MTGPAGAAAGQTVRRQFVWLFTARIAAAAVAFAATVAVARYLGPERFGHFSILVVLSKVLFDLVSPALDATAVRFTARELGAEGGAPERYFRQIVRLKALLIVLILAGGLVLAAPLKARLLPGAPISVFVVYAAFPAGGALIFWSLSQVYFQARQQIGRMAAFEALNAVLRLGVLAALIAAALYTPFAIAESGLFIAQSAVALGVGLVGFALVPRRYCFGPASHAAAREVLAYAKWILAACACTALSQAVDVFVLAALNAPAGDIGAFRAAVALIMGGELAILTLFQVLLPRASQLTGKEQLGAFLRRYQIRAVAVGLCLLAGIAIAPPVARLVFGPAYAATGDYFAILLGGTAFMLSTAPAGAVVYAIGRARLIAALEAAKLVLIVAASIPAAMYFGGYGVAAAVAASRALVAILTFAAARWAVARMA